jgi:hypothetical protein
MEKIKRGKERVDIRKLRTEQQQEPEISGGYIFKRDHPGAGERGFLTGQEFALVYVDPKEAELTSVQKKWLANFLDRFEKSLFGRQFRDAAAGYTNYIDMDSFIDFHWLVEVARNTDGYWFSEYMHKDREGPIRMGPIWDWDSTFGNPYFGGANEVEGWRFSNSNDPAYVWYARMFEDPDFLQRYIDRWSELRTNVLATRNVLALVDRIAVQVEEAQVRNSRRWPISARQGVIVAATNTTYRAEVDRLKRWIQARLTWIDSQDFPKPTVQSSKEGERARVGLSASAGRIFYTTNGSDPRLPGGGVSQAAFEYRAPVALGEGGTLLARVRSDWNLWSAPVVVKPQ